MDMLLKWLTLNKRLRNLQPNIDKITLNLVNKTLNILYYLEILGLKVLAAYIIHYHYTLKLLIMLNQ